MFQKFCMVVFALVGVRADSDSFNGCTFDMTTTTRTTPLFIKNILKDGNEALFMPETSRSILTFPQDVVVNLQCPGSYLRGPSNINFGTSVFASCVCGDNFIINGTRYSIKDLKCNENLKVLAQSGAASCPKDFLPIGLGWRLSNNGAIKFLKQIEICFYRPTVNTVWAKYSLSRYLPGQVTKYPISEYLAEGYAINYTLVHSSYERDFHQSSINNLLGITKSTDQAKYVSMRGNNYLARGLLAGKQEFVHGYQQDVTQHYYNIVPQWQTFYGENWNNLEKYGIDLVKSRKVDLDVYAGTFGIDTLPHISTNARVDLYLRKPFLPVPKYVYKVYYNSNTTEGVAIVGINSPHNQISSSDVFCPDVCRSIRSWFKLSDGDRKSVKKGYMFCCKLSDFKSTVTYFPLSSSTLLN